MHDDPFEHGHFGEDEEAIFGSIDDDGTPESSSSSFDDAISELDMRLSREM